MTDPRSAAAQAVSSVLNALSTTPHRVVVDSPPGAGKTTLVVEAARHLSGTGEECIIIAQTNQQVDDLVRRLSRDTDLTTGRLTSTQYLKELPHDLHNLERTEIAVTVEALMPDTPRGRAARRCQVIVATAAKWAKVAGHRWRWAIIDEAYQMRSDALLLVGNLFERALFVGDPGQLDPFSTVETERYVGLPYDPTNSAVAVLLASNPDIPVHGLPVSWRLPPSAADVISKAFYPAVPFTAGTITGDRRMSLAAVGGTNRSVDRTLQMAAQTGWALHELPARDTLPTDPQSIQATVEIALRLLELGTTIADEATAGADTELRPCDIAIGTTHRAQALLVRQALDRNPRVRAVTADTANRLQGREFAVTIVLHPLSGRRDASAFHLEAGRLCVLTSRHRHACIVVARAGIDDVLEAHPGIAPVHLNTDPKFPDGWTSHRQLLDHLLQFRVAASPPPT